MPKRDLWDHNAPKVLVDHRARDGRLRLERVERLLLPRVRVNSRRARHGNRWLRRVVRLLSVGVYGDGTGGRQIEKARRDWRARNDTAGTSWFGPGACRQSGRKSEIRSMRRQTA